MKLTDAGRIAREMLALDRAKAAQMTDAQLACNISTYRSSSAGTANYYWREVCLAEQAKRAEVA
jgi:hypothetical protein